MQRSGPTHSLIRPARRGDRRALLRSIILLQEAERRLEPRLRPGRAIAPAYYAQLRRRCLAWQGRIFVAEQAGEVVGFVAVLTRVPFADLDDPPGTYALVTDLVIDPACRRKGLGRLLLGKAEAFARSRHATELRIGVLAANRPATNLYRKVGFAPCLALFGKRLRGASTG